jgi:ABC-type multidrug transport system fused ATPase/permease subunit
MFYDQTPAGRILNRFSRDLDTLDAGIADQLAGIVSLVFVSISTVTVISGVMPVLIVFFVPLTSVYYVMMQYYRATSRELNRVVSVAASPIYSHFAESLNGVQTIRAYPVPLNYRALNLPRPKTYRGQKSS